MDSRQKHSGMTILENECRGAADTVWIPAYARMTVKSNAKVRYTADAV
jgi:hypothetical protein